MTTGLGDMEINEESNFNEVAGTKNQVRVASKKTAKEKLETESTDNSFQLCCKQE